METLRRRLFLDQTGYLEGMQVFFIAFHFALPIPVADSEAS